MIIKGKGQGRVSDKSCYITLVELNNLCQTMIIHQIGGLKLSQKMLK